jgi:hypothetical protein
MVYPGVASVASAESRRRPDYFTADTPTAVLVRQVLGAIAEFEKTALNDLEATC